jgi:predicted nucleotidyltransferase
MATAVQPSLTYDPAGCKRDAHVVRRAAVLFADNDVLAVLVVGSLSRGLASANSDADLAVLIKRPALCPGEKYFESDGTNIGIEWHDVRSFYNLPDPLVLHTKELCDAGRLSLGRVVHSRWDGINAFLKKLSQAKLHPADASDLLNIASKNLQCARIGAAPELRLRHAQGAALALAELRVSFTPARYQKPKWTIHDLALSGDSTLMTGINNVVNPSGKSGAEFCRVVRHHMKFGEVLLKAPFLTRTAGETFEDYYIRHTMRDAASLVDRGDDNGATLTALVALRLVAVRLSETVDPETRWNWEAQALRSIYGNDYLQDGFLSRSITALDLCRNKLAEMCSNCYRSGERTD